MCHSLLWAGDLSSKRKARRMQPMQMLSNFWRRNTNLHWRYLTLWRESLKCRSIMQLLLHQSMLWKDSCEFPIGMSISENQQYTHLNNYFKLFFSMLRENTCVSCLEKFYRFISGQKVPMIVTESFFSSQIWENWHLEHRIQENNKGSR